MAVGRKVNTERLDLEAAGIAYDRSGIKVDGGLRTEQPTGLCDRRCGRWSAIHPCGGLPCRCCDPLDAFWSAI